MRKQSDIETLCNKATDHWDRTTDAYTQGVMDALQWVLDPCSEFPAQDEWGDE